MRVTAFLVSIACAAVAALCASQGLWLVVACQCVCIIALAPIWNGPRL